MNTQIDSNSSITDIAKDVRKQIKAAKKDGTLPASMKVSVTCDKYAGGQSMRLSIVSVDENPLCEQYIRWVTANPDASIYDYCSGRDGVTTNRHHLADWAIDATEFLKSTVGQYHWDKSDIQSDYSHCNFYYTVEFDWKLRNDKQEEIVAMIEAEQSESADLAVAVAETEEETQNVVAFPVSDKSETDIDSLIEIAQGELMRAEAILENAKKLKKLNEIKAMTMLVLAEAERIQSAL